MKWKNEKETLAEIKKAKGELEQSRLDADAAESIGDLTQDRRDPLRQDPRARTRHRNRDETPEETPADAPRSQRRDHRRRHRRRRLPLDGRAGLAHARRRSGKTLPHGGRAEGPHRRPGRSRAEGLRRDQTQPRRHQRPQPSRRLVPVPRSYGSGEDGTHALARGIPFQQRQGAHPRGHVGIHGKALASPR